MSWRGLRHKGVEVLRPEEWNAAVDALNDLYSWLFAGISSASFGTLEAVYGHFESARIDSLSAGTASFDSRPTAGGRAVLLDGDPISVYQFYDLARSQITGAIDAARATALLEQLYGRVPSAADITSAVDAARVTQHAAAIAQKLDATNALLQQIYGKTPAAPDVTAAIDAAAVTGHAASISEHSRRAADMLEAYAPRLATIEQYAGEVRDVVVRISVDEHGRVGVKIAEPLDEYGYIPSSILIDRVGLAKDSTLQLLARALQSVGGDRVLVTIAGSDITVPASIRARYKPPGMVLFSGTVTDSGSSGDIDVSQISSLRVMVKVTSVSGIAPTLDVYVEGKYEATGDYVALLSRTGISNTGVYELGQLDNLCFRYIRVRWAVGGTMPSFTFTVAAHALA